MATKKKTTKRAQPADVLTFNKKNTLALADAIYTDKGGVLTLLKLCEGTLKNGKDGGRTTHCAVGEAYFTFVNTNMSKVLRQKTHKSAFAGVGSDGPTAAVIDELVNVAQLKKNSEDNKKKLALALDEAVETNDDSNDEGGIGEYAERSQRVANVFRKKVAPLLK